MLISIAGRVAKAFVAETPGVYRPAWSMEQVGAQMEAIRDTRAPLILPVLPYGFGEHLRLSFAMARKGI